MQKLNPINIESYDISLHPLRPIDMIRVLEIEEAVYELFSDIENTLYIPNLRFKDKKEATNCMTGFVLGYHTGLIYAHLITFKSTQKVIGLINVISPERASQLYKLDKYEWMIDYYLHKNYWGKGIMTGLIQAVCERLRNQGIETLSAVCDRQNQSSLRVLEKVGFHVVSPFDVKQDYFELTMNNFGN